MRPTTCGGCRCCVGIWRLTTGSNPKTAVASRRSLLNACTIWPASAFPACAAPAPDPPRLSANVDGTRRTAELALSLAAPPRLLFTSSSHVYTPPQTGYRVNEQAELGRQRGYGLTKQAAEDLLRDFSRAHGLEVVIVRAFQHAGPGQSEQMMLAQWARQFALGTDPVVVYNLDTYIDLTDVRDIVRAYRLLALTGAPGQVYNVGSGTRQRTGDIFETLRRMADPHREHVELRPGRKCALIADNSRLRRDTFWSPRIAMASTVEDVYADWLSRCASSPSAFDMVSQTSGSQVS